MIIAEMSNQVQQGDLGSDTPVRRSLSITEDFSNLMILREIGKILDSGRYPNALAGGAISPETTTGSVNDSGKEQMENVQGQSRKGPVSGRRSTGWERSSRRKGQ